jgi:glutathionylspermidine synthase
MRRVNGTERQGWRERVEEQGLIFHTNLDGSPYWNETAHYEFARAEIDSLEAATNGLYALCLEAGQQIIDRDLFAQLKIPPAAVPLIRRAWEAEPASIYGRMDLAYDGSGPPKLLEFNADTPTALLEAAVIQWTWLEDVAKGADQFNSIHERLVAKWTELRTYLRGGPRVHFTAIRDSWEDEVTCAYMADCASQAGLETHFLAIDEIGWDRKRERFVDLEEHSITSLFKLYPWEWLLADEFGAHIPKIEASMDFIEPIWRMMWSNKGLLAVLWEMFPGHPNLLPAYFDGPRDLTSYVKKPLLSREGANVTIVQNGQELATEGDYGAEGFVFQEYRPLPVFDGQRPVLGSWLVDGESAGMGIRESTELVTRSESHFVPHLFR